MNWYEILFPLALMMSATAAIIAAITAWQKKTASGAFSLVLLLLIVSIWSITSGIAGLLQNTALAHFNILLQVGAATFFLIFALEYIRQDNFIFRRQTLLLGLIPALIVILAISGEALPSLSIIPVAVRESMRPVFSPENIHWLFQPYIYLIRFIATIFIVVAIIRYPASHRAHGNYLLAASVAAWLGLLFNLPQLDNLRPAWQEAMQPVSYALSGIIIAWGIFQHKLIDLVPIARDTLLDNILNGIIVLDNHKRVVDINLAARYLLQIKTGKQVIGASIDQLLSHLSSAKLKNFESDIPYHDLYIPAPADLHLEVVNTPVFDLQNKLRGTMLVLHDISSRVRSETAMRQSEENLRNVFEHAPFPIIVTACQDGQILYINPAGSALYRVENKSINSLNSSDFYQNIKTRNELIAQLEKTGQLDNIEVALKTSENQPFWANTSVRKINYNGQNALLVTQIDISEQKRNFEELQQSRAQLKNIFEHADAGIYLLDPSGSITFSNERWAELLDVPAAKLTGKNLSNYIFKSDIPYSRYLFESLIAQEVEKFSLELRYRRADNSLFWGALSAIPIFDSKNQIVSIVNFVSDITQKKETENALKESERRFREILEKIYLLAIMLDNDANITFCNEYFLNKTGWQPREILGENWFDIFPTQKTGQNPQDYKRAIQMETLVSRHENEILTSTGETLLIAWSNILLRDANGKVIGSASIGEDITERRQAQQAERAQRLFAEALYDTATAITSTLEFDEVLNRILENLDSAVETTSANISLIEGNNVRFVRAKGYENYGISNNDVLKLNFSLKKMINMKTMYESKEPLCIPNTEKYPDWIRTETSDFIKSYIGAPIVVKNKVVGFISIDSNIPDFFNNKQAERLQAFSAQAAIAIENTRLYTNSQHELEERKRAQARLKRANKKLQAQLEKIEALQTKLKEQSIRDALTGLFNRRYLEEILPVKIDECRSKNLPLSLMMVDIDHFKVVNDNYGHQAGDEILQYLGKLFQQQLSPQAIACRYGGEEFAIVLPGIDLPTAKQYAEKLRLTFKQYRHKTEKAEIQSTVSIGLAYMPKHGNTGHGLLTAADNALYKSKYGGRNCITVAE